MENASKALIIAGGILLALMTLSLIVYMTTATNRMAQAQDEKVVAEQLAEFNRSYEAYNKTRLYGTEMITVVNKAIDYNKSLTSSQANLAMNITITGPNGTALDDFVTTKNTKITYKNGTVQNLSTTIPGASFTDDSIIIGYNTANNVKNFFKQETVDTTATNPYPDRVEQITTYSALANFKRTIFKCTRCEDENKDGRIDIMEFEQYKSYNEY